MLLDYPGGGIWIGGKGTHIRVVSELFDDGVIKMSRITQKGTSNVVSMLQPPEGIIKKRDLGPFSKFQLLSLVASVQILNPGVMGLRPFLGDVALELDDVCVRDGWSVLSGENGC